MNVASGQRSSVVTTSFSPVRVRVTSWIVLPFYGNTQKKLCDRSMKCKSSHCYVSLVIPMRNSMITLKSNFVT